MKKIFSIALLVALSIFFILLIKENTSEVTFGFYFIQYEGALFKVILMSFIVGLLFGVLIMSLSVMRNKLQVGKAQRQLSKVEKEVQNLRATPTITPVSDEA